MAKSNTLPEMTFSVLTRYIYSGFSQTLTGDHTEHRLCASFLFLGDIQYSAAKIKVQNGHNIELEKL